MSARLSRVARGRVAQLSVGEMWRKQVCFNERRRADMLVNALKHIIVGETLTVLRGNFFETPGCVVSASMSRTARGQVVQLSAGEL